MEALFLHLEAYRRVHNFLEILVEQCNSLFIASQDEENIYFFLLPLTKGVHKPKLVFPEGKEFTWQPARHKIHPLSG